MKNVRHKGTGGVLEQIFKPYPLTNPAPAVAPWASAAPLVTQGRFPRGPWPYMKRSELRWCLVETHFNPPVPVVN